MSTTADSARRSASSGHELWACSASKGLKALVIAGGLALDPVELQHLDGVAPQHLVGHLVVEVGGDLLDVRLRVRPRGVGVRVVDLEADVVATDGVEVVQAVVVGGEAAEDATVVVARRGHGNALLGVLPAVVL